MSASVPSQQAELVRLEKRAVLVLKISVGDCRSRRREERSALLGEEKEERGEGEGRRSVPCIDKGGMGPKMSSGLTCC